MLYVTEAGRTTWLTQSAGENVIQAVLQEHAEISVETEHYNYFTVQLEDVGRLTGFLNDP
jgi:hypothetical protein